jgi:hypothetical protein
MRTWIIIFWVFIIVALLVQLYDYNKSLDRAEVEHPQQKQFFFIAPSQVPVVPAAPPAQHSDAYLVQSDYTVDEDTPARGSFTCHVTLTNKGLKKAVAVQVDVRPFRGMRLGNEDAGHNQLRTLSDTDPLAQFGQWLAFPDIAPGQSVTEDVVFLNRPGAHPVVPGGSDGAVPGAAPVNLQPDIAYQTEKSQP